MISVLDQLFSRVRATPFFYRFTLLTRILLAAGFLPTGLVKLLGLRFTTIEGNQIGDFFEAMYQTGTYWQFLGASQMVAASLLLFPRLAHLGAALFLPIMVNIVVITLALDFTGTWVISILMLLAVVYLCAWDYHRFRSLFTEQPWPDRKIAHPRLDRYERLGFFVFAGSLMGFFFAARGFGFGSTPVWLAIAVGALAGLFVLGRFITLEVERRRQ